MAWRRIAKWSLIVFFSVFLLLLAALVAVHFALKSGELTQQTVPKLEPYLKPLGIELQKLGSARIDSLRSVQLRNIQLIWRDPKLGDVQFSAARFDASYDLPALLSGRLQINQVLLSDARISAHLRPSAATQAAAQEKPASREQISELLRVPPIPLLVKAININNVELDLLINFDQGTTKQSFSYKGLLQQIAMKVQWRKNHLTGDVLTALGQNGKSALLVSLTQKDQTLELEAAPAIHTQAAWELNHDDTKWNLKNVTVEDHFDVPPIAIFQRTVNERKKVGSVAAIKADVTSHINSVAEKNGTKDPKKNPAADLTSIFPVKVSSSVTTAVNDLKMDDIRFNDAQFSGQADQHLTFNLDGEVNPLSLVFRHFQIKANQTLSIAKLDAQTREQHAVINDLSLHINTQASTKPDASVAIKNTLPLDFTSDINGHAQHIELHQVSNAKGEQALDAQLRPQFSVSASGQLQPFGNLLQALQVDFQPQLTMENVVVRMANGNARQEYRIARQRLSGTGSYKDETLTMDNDLNLENVKLAKKAKHFSMKNHIHLTSDASVMHPKVSIQSSLNKHATLALNIAADNQPKQLNAQTTLQVDLPKRLHSYYPSLDVLGSSGIGLLGQARINLSSKAQLEHGADSILSADFTTAKQWPVNLDGELRMTQLSRPRIKGGIILTKPATVSYGVKSGGQYQVALKANVPGILVQPLRKAVPLRAGLKGSFTWPLTLTSASGNINVQGEKALAFDLNMNDQPRHANIDSRISIHIDPKWQRYLAALKALGSTGGLASDLQLRADVKHPYNSITLLEPAKADKFKATVTLGSELKQLSSGPKTLFLLSKPVKLTQKLDWSKQAIAWQSQFSAPAVQLVKQVKVRGFSGNAHLNASPGDNPTKANLTLQLDKADLQLIQSSSSKKSSQKPIAIGQVVTPLHLQISASKNNKQIHLKDLSLNMADNLLDLKSSGSTSLDGQRAQLESSINVTLRPDLMTQPAISGKGSFSLPRLLTIKEGEKITVGGEMQFNNLDTALENFQIKGLDGRLMINEELLAPPDQLAKFRYLVHADPFQRVDYTRLQPYVDNPSLRIQNIAVGDKSFGPLLTNISLKQNLLRLPRIDMDLLGGHLSGQFYFDASPGAWKISLLGRLSQLDPRQLLPDYAPSKDSELSPMSARVALEFDLNQRLLEGRIDVTKISREQLLQLLDVMDPQHQDEQLAQVRTVLRFAYPKSVSLSMEHGLMDMTVVISALPKPVKAYGLPLTPLIQHFAGDTLDKLGDLPLE